MLPSNTAGRTLITVIMPAYNAARYIRQAIESALGQTFRDIELIVVDDGSTDGTAEIVEDFARRDTRIRLIRQQNQGIGAARNTAMAHARGQWFALLDSDDLWFPTYLAEEFEILARRPDLDILSANAFNLGGPEDGRPYKDAAHPHELRDISLLDLIRVEDSVCILSIFRRAIVDTIGGFDTQLSGSEDYDLWLRAAAAGFRIGFNPTPLGIYRRRPDSVSADELRMLDSIAITLEKVRQRCPYSPELQEAAKQQLAKFARRRQVVAAKEALLRHDVLELRRQFVQLYGVTGAATYRMGAWLCGTAPVILFWMYRCKSGWIQQLLNVRYRS